MTTLVDEYLAEQSRLQTPVARFAAAPVSGGESAFVALIPLSAPTPGRQYAFEVDLDACSGCKACVAACHSLNGLDEHETWRDIGQLVGESQGQTFTQTVTTACHHCEDPGCLNGCPVLAYEKDSVTGIVRHLDDQCIGCSYCIFKCPYDVPKYNRSRGIVRKCDMCTGRLAHGEPPACVQACPTHAIRITTVEVGGAPGADFLPGAPDPAWTRPTTRYVFSRPDVTWKESAETAARAPEPAHWPLVLMTTLAGFGVGCSVVAASAGPGPGARNFWIAGAGAGVLGLAASVGHLGQPLRAWRIFLGLRRSWMSREAMLVGLWALGAVSLAILPNRIALPWTLKAFVALVGAAGLFSSAMIYADTPRPLWAFRFTAPRFFGGAAVLACATVAAIAPDGADVALAVLYAALAGKCIAELWPLIRARGALRDTAALLRGPLRPTLVVRLASALSGAVLVAAAAAPLRWTGLGLLLAGELAERLLFFRSVSAPRMPGVVHE